MRAKRFPRHYAWLTVNSEVTEPGKGYFWIGDHPPATSD